MLFNQINTCLWSFIIIIAKSLIHDTVMIPILLCQQFQWKHHCFYYYNAIMPSSLCVYTTQMDALYPEDLSELHTNLESFSEIVGLTSAVSLIPCPLNHFCRDLLGEVSWQLVGNRIHQVRSSTGGKDERNGGRRDQEAEKTTERCTLIQYWHAHQELIFFQNKKLHSGAKS